MANFLKVLWANSYYGTQVRMGQMSDNDEYLRDRSDFHEIQLNKTAFPIAGTTGAIDVLVDGGSVDTLSLVTGGTHKLVDIDISGLSPGLHTLEIKNGAASNGPQRFILLQDHDYLSVWISATGSSGNWVVTQEFAVTHREAQGW